MIQFRVERIAVSGKRFTPVFTERPNVYTDGILATGGEMADGKTRAHKHFRLNSAKLRRAQKLLRAGTETEAVERALDLVIAEHERNRITAEANERLIKSGVAIKDVYGLLEE